MNSNLNCSVCGCSIEIPAGTLPGGAVVTDVRHGTPEGCVEALRRLAAEWKAWQQAALRIGEEIGALHGVPSPTGYYDGSMNAGEWLAWALPLMERWMREHSVIVTIGEKS